MPRKPKQEKAAGVFEKPKGSGIWWIRYTGDDGRRHAESVGRFADARDLYQQRRVEKRAGIMLPARRQATRSDPTLSDLIDDALVFSAREHRDSKGFRQRVEVVREEFGNRPASSVKPAEWRDWLDEQADEHKWADATFNKYRAAISLVYSLAREESKLVSNPASLFPQRKLDNGRTRFLDDAEVGRLRETIAHFRPHCLYQFDVALYTGMRQGEQFRTEWSNVDLILGHIYIPKELSKNKIARYVYLNDKVWKSLSELKEEHIRRKFTFPTLFHDHRGKSIRSPKKWFERACEEAKIQDVGWHHLRHTFASNLTMQGENLKTVQDLMGHRSITMTIRYAHLSPAHLRDAVQRLGA